MVSGFNFVFGSQVAVDGTPVPTTFINSTQLLGAVPANFLALPGGMPISVTNPGDLGSNQIILNVLPPPEITADTPQDVNVGSPGFTLSVVGSQFVQGCKVVVGSNALATTYISANQISAFVPASLLLTSGRFPVEVQAPDGPLSNQGVLIVTPILSSLGNVQISGNQVTIDAIGEGFVADDALTMTSHDMQLNLPTSFISSTLLRATVTTAALAAGGGEFNVFELDGVGAQNYVPFSLPLVISSFTPGGAFAGGPAFNLIVSDEIFPSGSLVVWNLAPLTTTWVSLTELIASVPASLIVSPGVNTVSVLHPDGNRVSLPFAVNAGLTILDVSPASATAGGASFTLTLDGGGFLPDAMVVERHGAFYHFCEFGPA